MATVSVRYIVTDVDAAIEFYCEQLGFAEVMHPAPTFAMLVRGDLRLTLSAPGGGPGGGATLPDGTRPAPGGWNRFAIEVADLDQTIARLRAGGAALRTGVIAGVGGRQALVEDPSGNPVELFEPTRAEARLDHPVAPSRPGGPSAGADPDGPAGEAPPSWPVRPVGHVESSLVRLEDAPRQGELGAPDAWLVIRPELTEAVRDVAAGEELLVLTWLDRSRRDELSTVPGSTPGGSPRGVFSTRSPARPNPIGLHRVTVRAVEPPGRLLVGPLEVVDGTPLVDLKPVLHPKEG